MLSVKLQIYNTDEWLINNPQGHRWSLILSCSSLPVEFLPSIPKIGRACEPSTSSPLAIIAFREPTAAQLCDRSLILRQSLPVRTSLIGFWLRWWSGDLQAPFCVSSYLFRCCIVGWGVSELMLEQLDWGLRAVAIFQPQWENFSTLIINTARIPEASMSSLPLPIRAQLFQKPLFLLLLTCKGS